MVSPEQPRLSLDPSELNFSTVTVGNSRDLTFTLSNPGGGLLTAGINLSPESAEAFNLLSADSITVGAGAQQAVTVRFSPSTIGTVEGMVNIVSDGGSASVRLVGTGEEGPMAPVLEVMPEGLDFGNVLVNNSAERIVTVANRGGVPLNVTANTVAPFRIEAEASFRLEAGQSREVRVRFTPLTSGTFSGTLEVSASNGERKQVTLAGIGGSCGYSITPTSQAFEAEGGMGSVAVSTTPESGCEWSASSNVPWIMITNGTSGSGAGTVSYTVAANPEVSQRSGTLTIAGQPFTVTQAEAAGPALEITPEELDFGTVLVNNSADRVVTVTNRGGVLLNGTAITAAPFSIAAGASFSLGAGQSQAITVRFSPMTAGPFNGTVIVNYNGDNASVNLSGMGSSGGSLSPACQQLLVGEACGTPETNGICVSLRTPENSACQGACAEAVANTLRVEGITVTGPLFSGFLAPPGCVGFRPDIGGTPEGAQCLVDLLGPAYQLADPSRSRFCNFDGFPYNVFTGPAVSIN